MKLRNLRECSRSGGIPVGMSAATRSRQLTGWRQSYDFLLYGLAESSNSLDGTNRERYVAFMHMKPTFYEFFAGGGMARAGLGAAWECLFANDFDEKKVAAYAANWGDKEIRHGDINKLTPADVPGRADLAWASFPCQDLSLAGNGAGLAGERSGTFWGFYNLIFKLRGERRAPGVLVLENVVGLLSSHKGKDFADICRALSSLGYVFGALVMDAVHFVPQSRPRLFIVAVQANQRIDPDFVGDGPVSIWSSRALERAHNDLPFDLKAQWRWWNVPGPVGARAVDLEAIIENCPNDVAWHTPEETDKLVRMMSPANRQKLERAKASGKRTVGAVYRRTRIDENGAKVQRAEIRTDGVAGCLRTPGGGSSRQFLMLIEGERVRSRLVSGREAARLMGLADGFHLPAKYNETYHLLGDGLAVPVVAHLGETLLFRLLSPLAIDSKVA